MKPPKESNYTDCLEMEFYKYIGENMTIEDVKEDIAKMSDKQKDYYKEQFESFVESIKENYYLTPSEQERLESFTNSFFNYID